MSREYNPPSWHTMEGCFVGWLDDWLKCWMRQRRKSTTRYSLENFCCISLKIFGEPDTPIRIYAHPTNLCETKFEMSGKSDEGQKNMRILIISGFAVFEEKKLKRIDFQHMSLLLLLKWGHWQAVEKLLKSHVFGRDVERFCEEIDVANLGETNPWGEGDRVKWATCGRGDPYLMFERDILQYSTIFYNIWCLSAACAFYKCDGRQEVTHFDSHFPLLQVGW